MQDQNWFKLELDQWVGGRLTDQVRSSSSSSIRRRRRSIAACQGTTVAVSEIKKYGGSSFFFFQCAATGGSTGSIAGGIHVSSCDPVAGSWSYSVYSRRF